MLKAKDYCDYDTSRSLKELGFICGMGEYPCCIYDDAWHDQVDRPLLYETQKWMREERNILVIPELGIIHRNKNGIMHYYRVLVKNMNNGIIITLDNDRDDFESYEEALSEGIKEAIKLLKECENTGD